MGDGSTKSILGGGTCKQDVSTLNNTRGQHRGFNTLYNIHHRDSTGQSDRLVQIEPLNEMAMKPFLYEFAIIVPDAQCNKTPIFHTLRLLTKTS